MQCHSRESGSRLISALQQFPSLEGCRGAAGWVSLSVLHRSEAINEKTMSSKGKYEIPIY